MLRQLYAAVLVPFCYFGSLLVAGLLYPGYSHVTQLPSELGAVDSPHPLIFNTGLVLTGLALLFASPGIVHAAIVLGARRLWATSLFFALVPAGVYFVLIGLIALPDPRHNALFPLLLPLQLGPFLLAVALRPRREAASFLRYLVATGVLLVALLLVALGLMGLVTSRNQGLFFRVYALVGFSWIGVAGATFRTWIRAARHSAPAAVA